MQLALRIFLRVGLASLSLPMLYFALPPQHMGPLVLVALVPILVALHNTRWVIGLVSGPILMGSIGAAYELGLSPSILDRPLAGAALVLFVIFGVTFGFPLALAASSWSIRRIILVSAAAVAGEGILLFLVPGHIALALARQPLALSVAAIGSIWAVTFLIWWVNTTIAAWIVTREGRYLYVASAVIPIVCVAWLLTLFNAQEESDSSVELVAIQTYDTYSYRDWESLHLRASAPNQDGRRPDVVVWPELSAQLIVEDNDSIDQLLKLAQLPGASPFVTTFPSSGPDLKFNTAAMFTTNGVSAYYFKRHPYADERQIHDAGTQPRTVSHNGVHYGLAICFDSCFPSSMRATARTLVSDKVDSYPDVILLPTLDPPDHTGVIQAMHAASTPFRAAELGLPIVRADITAFSMIVNARGEILAEAGVGEEIIQASVLLSARSCIPAMYVGDGVLYCSILIVVCSGVVTLVCRRTTSTQHRS